MSTATATATVATHIPSTPPDVEPEVSLKRNSDTDVLAATTEYPDLSILSGPAFKDARAAAHDKQRSKKAGDRAKGRGSKHGMVKPSGLHGHGANGEERKYAALGEREVEADWLTLKKGADGDLDAVDVQVPSSRCTCGRGHRGEGKGEGVKTEVRLLDLVRPAKRRGGVRDDFEVVPPVKSVIVLDDRQWLEDREPRLGFALELGLGTDEAWEYVSSEDSEPEGNGSDVERKSYAQVVAKVDGRA